MSSNGSVPFDKVSTLRVALEKIERQHFGNLPEGLLTARGAVIAQLGSFRSSRWRLGSLLRSYKAFYVHQQGWVAAAKVIGEAIDRSERSIFRIIEDYERAAELPPSLLEELEKQGIDPAARKNAGIVEDLARARRMTSAKQAAKVVSIAMESDRRRKSALRASKKKQSSADLIRQIIVLIAKRCAGMPPEEAQTEMKRILLGVAEGLGIDIVSPRLSLPKHPRSGEAV